MNDNIKVNTEALKQISSKILDEKNEIMNIYKLNIKNVIQNSQQFLGTEGIEIGDIEIKINKLFTKFDKSMTELTDALSDNIVPGYINLNEEIKNLFGGKFASEMEALINKKE